MIYNLNSALKYLEPDANSIYHIMDNFNRISKPDSPSSTLRGDPEFEKKSHFDKATVIDTKFKHFLLDTSANSLIDQYQLREETNTIPDKTLQTIPGDILQKIRTKFQVSCSSPQ